MLGSVVGFSGLVERMALFLVQSNLTWNLIHFICCSRVVFLGSADRVVLFPVRSNPRWQPAAILENFEWLYFRNGSFDPLHIWFLGTVFMASRSNGFTSGWTKSKRWLHVFLENSEWIYLSNGLSDQGGSRIWQGWVSNLPEKGTTWAKPPPACELVKGSGSPPENLKI